MFNYCLGVRVNDVFQERVCEFRERCKYYTNTNLSVAFSRPDEYQELDTYNNNECIFIDKEWKKTEICETLESQMDGMMTLLKSGLSK